MSRIVTVSDREQEIFSYQYNKPVSIGRIIQDAYHGDDLYSYKYVPHQDHLTPEDKDYKTYDLGILKRDTRIIDPFESLSPLVDEGWEIKTFWTLKNGRGYHAILQNPDVEPFSDPINWDSGLWSHRRLESGPMIHEALVVRGSLSPKRSIEYSRALFRLICTNGLTADIMNFGSVRIQHAKYDRDQLIKNLQTVLKRPMNPERMLGPRFGEPQHAIRLADFMERNYLSSDDDSVIHQSRDRVPQFLRDIHDTFESLPIWYLEEYIVQMRMMGNNLNRDIYCLDVLNSITNPISLESTREEPHSFTRIISKQKSILDATEQMMGIMSLSLN